MTYDGSSAIPPRSSTVRDRLRLLITDRRIQISWFVFLAFGVLDGVFLLNLRTASPPVNQLLHCTFAGYWAWSMYWGVPGCISLFRRLWGRLPYAFSMLGCTIVGIVVGVALIALVYYPPLGGGIFHFIRRWWLISKRMTTGGVTPAPVANVAGSSNVPVQAPASVSAPAQPVLQPPPHGELLTDIEQRLRALVHLHEKGIISRDEHDRQRSAILEKI